ncbi:MAG: MMPL family transporter [Myxococcales bacterium]|nr:MMPL family transporter [Myxococcales bacterium]
MPSSPHISTPEHPRETENPFFRRWAELVLRFRWLFLGLTLVGSAGFAYLAATQLTLDNSVEAFASSNSNARALLEDFRDEFGKDGYFIVMAKGDVFTPEFLGRLEKLHRTFEALDMDIPSLGQRKQVKGRKTKAQTAPTGARSTQANTKAAVKAAGANDAAGNAAGASATTAGGDDAAGDDFGGDDFGDDFADFGEGEAAEKPDSAGPNPASAAKKTANPKADRKIDSGWGDEAGGSIVDEVTSLINVRQTTGKGGTLRVGKLMDPMPPASALPALKKQVLADSKLVGQVIGKSGTHAVLSVRTQFMSEKDSEKVYWQLKKICDEHETEGFELGVAGPPALGAALNDLMLKDLRRTGLVAIFAMLLALIFLFRHPMGVIGPIGVVVQAAIWTFGAMAGMGLSVTMLSNILPAFLVCVGIGDSVHIQSVYRDARLDGRSNRDAIIYSVATTAIPVLFTTLTTMVGLLSFRFASVGGISEMGTAGAWGVGVALTHSLIFLPIMLSFNTKSMLGANTAGGDDNLDRFLDLARDFSFDKGSPAGAPLGKKTPRRRRALILALLLAAVCGLATTQLNLFHHPITWFPSDLPVRLTFEEIDREVGGTANVQLLIEAKEGRNVKDLALLRGLEKLDAHIRSYVNPVDNMVLVGNTISLLDVIKETNQSLHDDDPAFYKLPDTDRGVSDLLFMFENAGPAQLRRLATNDLTKTQMTIRVRWIDASSYAGFTRHIETGIKQHIGDRATVKATGAIYSLFSVIANLISDLMNSFGIAFAAITVMMVLMLKDLKLGLIAMVPNLLPIVAIMGMMGLAGIPIDMANLLIASIAIGIAVDDTIHLLHHFQAHYRLNGKVEDAITFTFSHSGRAMVSTSVILCGGFCVYTTAQMSNIGRFGMLVATTVVLALLIDLLFSPALLRTFYKDKAPQQTVDQ